MKIVHCCLSCFYIDGYAYQENQLIRRNVEDGHEVLVVASLESYGNDRQLTYLSAGEYIGSEGARVIRMSYRQWLPQFLMKKLRIHSGLMQVLETEKPDVIMFHGLCGWEILTLKKYKAAHPTVKMYIDSHTDRYNSARTFISNHVLHGFYYKLILKSALKSFEKVLCISVDTISFAREVYKIPQDKIEFYPLGGEVYDDEQYETVRRDTRSDLGFSPHHLVLVQSGKMDSSKKIIESLRAFTKIKKAEMRFLIVGHLHDDVITEVNNIIKLDSRIQFLGWKSAEDLRAVLCAADVYVQPGSQSATMQMSVCCRCAVILNKVPSHEPYINANGFLVANEAELFDAILKISVSPVSIINQMSRHSAALAKNLLDYRLLAARLYD